MSTTLSKTELDIIDEDSKLTVFGFIRKSHIKNVPNLIVYLISYFYGIDISKAIIHLATRKYLFGGRNLVIDNNKMYNAFNDIDCIKFLEMGKRKFIRILSKQCQIKMGYGTKLWNYIKKYIDYQRKEKKKEQQTIILIKMMKYRKVISVISQYLDLSENHN